MAKNSSSDSGKAGQAGQVIRATGDLSPSRRHSAIDNTLNGKTSK